METLVKSSFTVNLIVMQILGFYPPQKNRTLYKLYAYIVYCAFTVSIPILAALDLIISENVDLEQISDNAFLVCQTGCFIVKFFPFIFKDKKVKDCIYMVEDPIFVSFSPNQEDIMRDCIKICVNICRLFLIFCLITLINWAIIPFFIPGKHLPIEIWLPFDYKKSERLYVISFIYVVAGVGNGAVSSGVIDPLLTGLTLHATSQLRLLKNNLENLKQYAEEGLKFSLNNKSEEGKIISDLIYKKIVHCVNHHNQTINFIKFFEETFSWAIFAQFAGSVVVICISCLRLSMVEPFTFTFFAMSLFLCTMLSEIFLYCYYGTVLFEENNGVIHSVYMGNWYEYDLKSKKALITLMERSRKPVVITAGRILDLSLETFTTIIRRAYSLLAVLKNY